ncbi:hypothetical protein GOB94_14055 [Granulicella sp. 5B5]|uniref:phage head-tail connector protein n=1 Tax=Granulicella sp. 5B5 TaxID=1617967 RepID=UPI0015F6620A|nr:phage head-tail connector protein [Granulicella sp. 5B5]QMV19689.1 hypothetical protein GOB94_14055 [Granulicella sp. 5B5]
MNSEIIQLSQPAVEPVLPAEAMVQLGLGNPVDSILNTQLTTQIANLLLAARRYCEGYTRSCYITTNWLYQGDHWPAWDSRYARNWYCGLRLPKPPFQSIQSFVYIDETGTPQTLPVDLTYGNSVTPTYAYQLDPGSDVKPARLLPAWARPWPPLRLVANAVQITFKSGFGGPVTASMANASAILTGPVFNPGDKGQSVSVPGAGAAGAALITTIASVDINGQATLADPAQAVVASTSNVYVGQPVPEEIRLAIKLATQFYYEQGAVTDLKMPRVVNDLLDGYVNRSA